MYRAMLRVILCDMCVNIRTKKSDWLAQILMIYFLLRIVFSAFRGNAELYQGILATVFTVAGLILLSCVASGMPLRLNRGIFICPVDDAWKMKYLSLEVAIKIGVDFLIVGLLVNVAIGRIFIAKNRILCVVQMILEIFTFLNTSLRIEVAEGSARKVDENGYRIQSKAEVMIKTYWMCLLILEWMFFGICVWQASFMENVFVPVIWGILLLGNLFLALKYVRPFLREILCYEDIYCRKPQEEVVQYDF